MRVPLLYGFVKKRGDRLARRHNFAPTIFAEKSYEPAPRYHYVKLRHATRRQYRPTAAGFTGKNEQIEATKVKCDRSRQ
jgi:hypothetical protein